jgi:hypothetical protein
LVRDDDFLEAFARGITRYREFLGADLVDAARVRHRTLRDRLKRGKRMIAEEGS